MKRLGLLLSVALLAGCACREEALEDRFAPLTRIVEVPGFPLEAGRITTLFTQLLTSDLAAIDSRFPVGSVEREAMLLHERVHALRQAQDPLWLVRYVLDSSFRLEEEKVGWRVEILYLRDNGVGVEVESWARSLATGYSGMVSYEDALRWVVSVLAERR